MLRNPRFFIGCGALLTLAITSGCGGSGDTNGTGGNGGGSGGSGGATTTGTSDSGGSGGTGGSTGGSGGTGGTGANGGTGGMGGSGGGTGGTGGSGGAPPVTADALLALTANCNAASNGKYATDDDGSPDTITVCGLNGAFFWKADMDIDCDGKTTAVCNLNTDPAYQNQTSTTDSQGNALDASTLPFVVIPLPSDKFAYDTSDLHLGGVVAVIYQGKLEFGIFGDEGPENIIGEASYAMANLLGIDSDPSTGGVDSGVTYIAFTGQESVVSKNEDHAEATLLGTERAAAALGAN
jgi:hypothetical protein